MNNSNNSSNRYVYGLIFTLAAVCTGAAYIYLSRKSKSSTTNTEKNSISETKVHQEKSMFTKATMYVKRLKLNQHQQLILYGLYKQATQGPCKTPKPSMINLEALSKWNAYNAMGHLSTKEAEENYISFVTELDPTWLEKMEGMPDVFIKKEEKEEDDEDIDLDDNTNIEKGGGGGGGGFNKSQSTVETSKEELSLEASFEESESIFYFAQEGNTAKVVELLKNKANDVNDVDEGGLTSLHWCCDRGHYELCKDLLTLGAKPNIQDNEGQTALSYAITCDRDDIALLLIGFGADISIKDKYGESPMELCSKELLAKINSLDLKNL